MNLNLNFNHITIVFIFSNVFEDILCTFFKLKNYKTNVSKYTFKLDWIYAAIIVTFQLWYKWKYFHKRKLHFFEAIFILITIFELLFKLNLIFSIRKWRWKRILIELLKKKIFDWLQWPLYSFVQRFIFINISYEFWLDSYSK